MAQEGERIPGLWLCSMWALGGVGHLARALAGGVRADYSGPGGEQEIRIWGGGLQELNT